MSEGQGLQRVKRIFCLASENRVQVPAPLVIACVTQPPWSCSYLYSEDVDPRPLCLMGHVRVRAHGCQGLLNCVLWAPDFPSGPSGATATRGKKGGSTRGLCSPHTAPGKLFSLCYVLRFQRTFCLKPCACCWKPLMCMEGPCVNITRYNGHI